MVAVLLGLTARAELREDRPGCGATDIDAPGTPQGDERLLVALVAGSEGEGRLLGQPRQWHASTEDAKAMLRLVGGLISDGSAARLSRAKRSAGRIVRDPRVWRAIEDVAARLAEGSTVDYSGVREAVGNAGLEPATFSL